MWRNRGLLDKSRELEVFKLVREGVLLVLTADVTLGIDKGFFCPAVTPCQVVVYFSYLTIWFELYLHYITCLMYNFLCIPYHSQRQYEQ